MKVRLPVMIKDTMHSEYLGLDFTENWEVDDEEIFLDGPVTRQIAVIDFDEATGELQPGVRFLPPPGKNVLAYYDVPRKPLKKLEEVLDPAFQRVCTFSAVLRTIKMFEHHDTLGRRLTWAFNSPQLLVVPRAGRWENAFYERESRSLQFFSFPRADKPEEMFHTSLSNDIVAHETGHAILDGIAPDLYNAITPQSLALHEAIADLVAVVMAFSSKKLALKILEKTRGSIRNSTDFAGLAEGFQLAMKPFEEQHFLRNLNNEKSLDPKNPNAVRRDEPHELSEVLSGALYAVVVKMHEDRVRQYSRGSKDENVMFSASGKALGVATGHFKRMIIRALDYLPPGEISFADYARAILAADQALYPERQKERSWLVQEFVRRGIVQNADALDVKTNFSIPAVEKLDLQTLVESDWAAYEFANTHRKLLGIPPSIHFRVRPRLKITKLVYKGAGEGKQVEEVHECIFKVSWDHKEKNNTGTALPAQRQITVGTTLAIDQDTRQVRALLTADYRAPDQREDRDTILKRLLDDGTLLPGEAAFGPDGKILQSAVHAEVMDGLMRVRGMARTLHICGGQRS